MRSLCLFHPPRLIVRPRTALITGVTGQDGRLLSQALVSKGYRVLGVARRTPEVPLPEGVDFVVADAADGLGDLVHAVRPDELYHLAAESHVARSWDDPIRARTAASAGAREVMAAARSACPSVRLLVATSSEVFAGVVETPQNENTPLAAVSPYGEGKADALRAVRDARARGEYVVGAILYNHESPLRDPAFLSRKVSIGVARIVLGLDSTLQLGWLDAQRDWCAASDAVDALWRSLQIDEAADYVIGSGVSRSVRSLVETAFGHVGLDSSRYVVTDPALHRPADTVHLVADPRRAASRLGWHATTAFESWVGAMVDADIERLRGARS